MSPASGVSMTASLPLPQLAPDGDELQGWVGGVIVEGTLGGTPISDSERLFVSDLTIALSGGDGGGTGVLLLGGEVRGAGVAHQTKIAEGRTGAWRSGLAPRSRRPSRRQRFPRGWPPVSMTTHVLGAHGRPPQEREERRLDPSPLGISEKRPRPFQDRGTPSHAREDRVRWASFESGRTRTHPSPRVARACVARGSRAGCVDGSY